MLTHDPAPEEAGEIRTEIERLRSRVAELELALRGAEGLRHELAESKLLVKAVLSASSDTVLILDQSGTVLAVNDAGAHLLRKTPPDMIGQSIFDFMPKELTPERKRWINEAVKNRKPVQFKDQHRGFTYGHRLYPNFAPHTNAVRITVISRDITESEKALKALRESEARYQAILQDQTELICRYLPDGRLSYVNEAYARFFDKDRRELINTNFIPHIPADDIAMIRERINGLSPEKPVTSFEHRIIMENGELRWQHWTHRAIYDSQGELAEYQAVGRNINKRKMAQEALEESEARYRTLFEYSPISLWEQDFSLVKDYFDNLKASGVDDLAEYFRRHPEEVTHCVNLVGVLDVNQATLDLLETEDKRSLTDLATCFTDEALDAFRRELIALARGETLYSCESVFRTLRGNLKNVAMHLLVAPGYEESLGKVLVSIIDVTETKRAGEELRENRAFLHQIIDTVPSPIFVKDKDGVFLMVNRAMAELYGGTVKDLVGKTGADFNPNAEETTIFRSEDLRVLSTREPFHTDQRPVTDHTGKKRWHSVTKLPLPGKEQILGVAVDITDQKQAEQERRTLERHFRQAQKMQALGTLAGGIAHDFNNMIFAILGFVRLAMKQAQEKTKIHEYLGQIQSAGMRASDLVRQILTFSRQTEQEKKPVHIAALFNEITRMLRATLPSTMDIITEVAPEMDNDGDVVLGDPTQIHQVLMNLCTNAAHSMTETGGVLTMSMRPASISPELARQIPDQAPGSFLEIRVSDTGHGIDPAIIEHIFDPFFTTKEPGEGTGMGLSVVHGIVKSHGGSVHAESLPGKGSTFTLFLPRLVEENCDPEPLDGPAPGGSESILFVDDEALLAGMAKDILSGLGYKVTALTSPREALDLFKENPRRFDLVITDQTMPEMTGMELAKGILEVDTGQPIIMLTGYSEQAPREEALKAGITEYIMKPVVEEQLARAIRNVLDKNR